MGWVVNVTFRPLYPRERYPVPIAQEAGWAPGLVLTGAENLAPAGIRSPDRPARSESLYRLSYPGPLQMCNNIPFANACILSTPLKLGSPGFVLTSALDVNSHNISVRVNRQCLRWSWRERFVLSPGSLGEAHLHTCVDYRWRASTKLSFRDGFCEGNARQRFEEYCCRFSEQRPPSVGHVVVYKNQRRSGTRRNSAGSPKAVREPAFVDFRFSSVHLAVWYGQSVGGGTPCSDHCRRLHTFQLEEYTAEVDAWPHVADQKHFVWRLG